MKTFTHTFTSYTDYVNAVNSATQKQCNVVETARGCEYVYFGERHILVNPSEHEVFEQDKFQEARNCLIDTQKGDESWMRGLELAFYKQSWIYWGGYAN